MGLMVMGVDRIDKTDRIVFPPLGPTIAVE